MRLFIGIPLASAVAAELADVTRPLRSLAEGLRWMPVESWHITLDFLGTTRPEQYTCIVAGLRELRHAAISIEFSEFGFFDGAGVFMLKVKLTPELAALQRAVAAVSAHCQFSPEHRPYRPHLTLARSKSGSTGLRTLKTKLPSALNLAGFTADRFALDESFPGSQYKVREAFPLTMTHAN